MADLPPPPDPAAVQAMMDAKTPNEAAMARVKMSSQEIWELFQQAEDFQKQDAFLELELKKRAAWDPDGAFRQSGYVPCARSRNAGGCKA